VPVPPHDYTQVRDNANKPNTSTPTSKAQHLAHVIHNPTNESSIITAGDEASKNLGAPVPPHDYTQVRDNANKPNTNEPTRKTAPTHASERQRAPASTSKCQQAPTSADRTQQARASTSVRQRAQASTSKHQQAPANYGQRRPTSSTQRSSTRAPEHSSNRQRHPAYASASEQQRASNSE